MVKNTSLNLADLAKLAKQTNNVPPSGAVPPEYDKYRRYIDNKGNPINIELFQNGQMITNNPYNNILNPYNNIFYPYAKPSKPSYETTEKPQQSQQVSKPKQPELSTKKPQQSQKVSKEKTQQSQKVLVNLHRDNKIHGKVELKMCDTKCIISHKSVNNGKPLPLPDFVDKVIEKASSHINSTSQPIPRKNNNLVEDKGNEKLMMLNEVLQLACIPYNNDLRGKIINTMQNNKYNKNTFWKDVFSDAQNNNFSEVNGKIQPTYDVDYKMPKEAIITNEVLLSQ
jgi:hypothetical protein